MALLNMLRRYIDFATLDATIDFFAAMPLLRLRFHFF